MKDLPGARAPNIRVTRCAQCGQSLSETAARSPGRPLLCLPCRRNPRPRPPTARPSGATIRIGTSSRGTLAPPGKPSVPPRRPLSATPAPIRAGPSPARPSPRRAAFATVPLLVFDRPPLGYAAVHCFRCGRRGLVPSRTLLTRNARDVTCPTCRGVGAAQFPGRRPIPRRESAPPSHAKPLLGRPPLILVRSKELAASTVPASGMVAVKCFLCGRAGRLPLQTNSSLRPEDVICPTCRARAGPEAQRRVVASARARPAPSPSPAAHPGL